MSVTVGLKGRAETQVTQANTRPTAACSGALPVLRHPLPVRPDGGGRLEVHRPPIWSPARAPWAPGWTSATTPPPLWG